MKKLALFMGLISGICAHKAQAQSTPQQILEEAISSADISQKSTCFNFLSKVEKPNTIPQSYVLELLYHSPTTGSLTKDHIDALKIFQEGINREESGYAAYFEGRTPEDRQRTLEDAASALEWVGNIDADKGIVIRKGGCPNLNPRP